MDGFDLGDFTITKREILASISIIAIMLLIGFLISGKIQESQLDKNEKYNKALKIEDSEMFVYGMRTNIGNAFIYGELKAVDTVTYPEIGGEYMYVKKLKNTIENILDKLDIPEQLTVKLQHITQQKYIGLGTELEVKILNVKKYHS